MNKIHPLPQDIISKIAAGEVIERPCFVIKELIENALDARANEIKIEMDSAGLNKIKVTDNGEGMSYVDIQQCFKPHTTSKLSTETDLLNIKTLGFRGEALSSIAAISELLIKSKSSDNNAGTSIEVKAGSLKQILPVGMPVGTSVMVNNLFYNVPARKNFLKSIQTESSHSINVVMDFALAFLSVRFTLLHNSKILFDLPENQELKERINVLFGISLYKTLIPLNYEDSYFKLNGYISRPEFTTKSMQKQYIFINGRRVKDKMILLAAKEAYKNLIEETTYPVLFLYLSLPYESIDVNVHPRKEKVNFINQRFIFDSVYKAVAGALENHNLTFQNMNWKRSLLVDKNIGNTKSYAGWLLKDEVIDKNKNLGKVVKPDGVIQIHNTYLLVQTKQGLLLIDQHAAHERILYQELLRVFEDKKMKGETSTLPQAQLLDISFPETEVLRENMDLFEKIGFEIEYFKDNIFKIYAVPVLFKDRNSVMLIRETLDSMIEENKLLKLDRQSNAMIEYLACRAAVKAGDPLSKQECKNLIDRLEKTENNYTCPHGRPTKIEITLSEISRSFKRT